MPVETREPIETRSPPVMVLWHRPGAGSPWQQVHAGTGQECTNEIGRSTLTGDWLTCAVGVDPNRARKVR